MHIIGYFAANLGISVPGSNVKPEQMGHILISNLGSLGIEIGFAPLCSPTFSQIVVSFGKARKAPVYDEKSDSIVAKEIMSSVFTFDHRYGDGALAAHAVAVVQDFVEDPENFDPSKHKDSMSVEERESSALQAASDEKKKN